MFKHQIERRFQELSWQTVRIEAKSTKNEDLTPLRLITNQARYESFKPVFLNRRVATHFWVAKTCILVVI